MERQDQVLRAINIMLKLCEPIKYTEFNKFLPAKNGDVLCKLEKRFPAIGISARPGEKTEVWGITTLSMIATITDILCKKRMQFHIDEEEYIRGVSWFDPTKDGNDDGRQDDG